MIFKTPSEEARDPHGQSRAKGKKGGRSIPLHPQLRDALTALHQARAPEREPWHPVIYSERGRGLSDCIRHSALQAALPIRAGASSSPAPPAKPRRRGGLCATCNNSPGHASLGMTQRYIEGDTDAKRKLVQMI
jgi:integrase/recombinase XerD